MPGITDVELGRKAYLGQSWRKAYDRLSAVDRGAGLDPDGLELLANAAYLIAKEDEAAQIWARAHNGFVDVGEIGRAVRVGFLLSLTALLKGQASIASGWLARMRRLLETAPERQVEGGFCGIILGLREMYGGDGNVALAGFERAVALATEYQDSDLLALALICRGQGLIALGRSEDGAACLDEAMVSVTSGAVKPIFSGIIYCAVILTCQKIFDIERASEWTNAFNLWCEPQPDLVPFRGQCLVHRSEVLQNRGDWQDALREAERACQWLVGGSEVTVGRAHYQKGELNRLLGEFRLADQDYREAARHGVDPQPGLALRRLGDGQTEAAVAAIRTACGGRYGSPEPTANPDRLKLLGPSVEIFLCAGETDTAASAAEELAAWARAVKKPVLEATSAAATGAVLAATDRPDDALEALRTSLAIWQRLGMPYEAARARVRLADVFARLGDAEADEAHRATACDTFRRLGAYPDLCAAERTPPTRKTGAAGLTGRQLEVLRLLAQGQSNRQIASELHISEHTVARHVSNIFDKTGVSTRAAAVDLAHREKLLG